MGRIRFDSRWQYNESRVLRLENELLTIDVLADLGAKIYRWVHKPEDRDWLWQHPRILPAPVPPGTNYDDNWSGGWDELFPNGAPEAYAGEVYPDHGEYWTRAYRWDVDQTADSITLHLHTEGSVTPTRMEKWITLRSGSSAVRIRTRLMHAGEHAFNYLWAMHPAMAIRPGCRVVVPARSAIVGSPGSGRLAEEPKQFTWPLAPGRRGEPVDLSRVPETAGVPGYEMVYLTELLEGWWAVFDPATRSGFGLAFDKALFNTVWVFQSHGGWRGLHVAILEACSGYPYELSKAASSGRCGRLEGGQVVETEATAVVFSDRDDVSGISPDGIVT